jgi:uncharacterized protein YjbI with pentapeptide repeats
VCTHATATGTILKSADLSGVQAIGVDFSFDDLDHADLSGMTLVTCLPPSIANPPCLGASFEHANLTGANLTDTGTSFCFTLDLGMGLVEVTCGGVDLFGASLYRANLTGDDLAWVDLANADLRQATFTSATFGECTQAKIELVTCSGADLQGVQLQRTSLQGLHFNDVQLQGANLSGADLTGTDFQPLSLLGLVTFPSSIDGANFTSANLTQANLTSVSAVGTNFTRARWSATICPDGTNSDTDGRTCVNNLG